MGRLSVLDTHMTAWVVCVRIAAVAAWDVDGGDGHCIRVRASRRDRARGVHVEDVLQLGGCVRLWWRAPC
eukprot:33754-Eustigmatos_ZCMA.PRE.1